MKNLIDVETAGDTKDAFTYDVSGRFFNETTGEVVEEYAFVIRDIFVFEQEMMKECYYNSKIPEYISDLRQGNRAMEDFMRMRRYMLNKMAKYNCNTVVAYNCSFDRNALNTTLRYLTKSRFRWFFPYNTNFECIWNMACQTICQTKEYKKFAEDNSLISNYGKNYRATAEAVFAFISNNPTFAEEHKGLEDVRIEQVIYQEIHSGKYELPRDKGINRLCWQKVKREIV